IMAQTKQTKQATKKKRGNSVNSNIVAWVIIILSVVGGILIYTYIFGNPANFVGGDPEAQPVSGGTRQFLGIIYKGGFVVPILVALVIITISFSIERFLTIAKATGKGNADKFITKIRQYLENDQIDE